MRLQLISDRFLGDIALPNIKYDAEWREQKLNKSYLEELNKYREEIFNEGLQVEEEGLTGEHTLYRDISPLVFYQTHFTESDHFC